MGDDIKERTLACVDWLHDGGYIPDDIFQFINSRIHGVDITEST